MGQSEPDRVPITTGPVRKFLILKREDRTLVVRAAVMVIATRLALLILPFWRVRSIVDRLAMRSMRTSDAPASATQLTWALAAAGRYLPGGSNCLVQALAAEVMLARIGCASELKIGVTKNETGMLLGHAWLESGGKVVIGEFDLPRYAMLGAIRSRRPS